MVKYVGERPVWPLVAVAAFLVWVTAHVGFMGTLEFTIQVAALTILLAGVVKGIRWMRITVWSGGRS